VVDEIVALRLAHEYKLPFFVTRDWFADFLYLEKTLGPDDLVIDHTITIERDKLYEQVWSEPIHKLCKQYFLSDRGLGKLCARHGIPVPPRGYWARVAHGHTPKRPPLPPLKTGQPRIIRIEKYLKRPPGEESQAIAFLNGSKNRCLGDIGETHAEWAGILSTEVRVVKARVRLG